MGQISNAVAVRETGPGALVEQYRADLAMVMPSHVNAQAWTRLAIGVLRRDDKLFKAAQNDPGSLIAALMDAAQKGLTPGTEEYYLVPRSPKRGARPVVAGSPGYQGYIEMMYRAGAVSSVIVETVCENDEFSYRPGRDEKPVHEIDWDSADRGRLRLVYAYGVMRDGAISKVVVLNRAKIMEIRAKSDSAGYDWSPWNTSEEAMWLKSAVRQLRKWVPTSAEYIRERLRAEIEVGAEQPPPILTNGSLPQPLDHDEGPIDGEIEPEGGWPNWPTGGAA